LRISTSRATRRRAQPMAPHMETMRRCINMTSTLVIRTAWRCADRRSCFGKSVQLSE
jgi:hypothetical protein